MLKKYIFLRDRCTENKATWRKRGNLLDRNVQNVNIDNDKINGSKEEKTSISTSIAKLDGGTVESHGETRRLHLHLQHRSGKIPNGSRVGAHDILHHLRNGGEFGFIPENRRRVPHECHNHHATTRGSRASRAQKCKSSLCPKESSHPVCCMSHPWLFSCAIPSLSTSSSSLTDPTTQQEHPVHHAHLQALPAPSRTTLA